MRKLRRVQVQWEMVEALVDRPAALPPLKALFEHTSELGKPLTRRAWKRLVAKASQDVEEFTTDVERTISKVHTPLPAPKADWPWWWPGWSRAGWSVLLLAVYLVAQVLQQLWLLLTSR